MGSPLETHLNYSERSLGRKMLRWSVIDSQQKVVVSGENEVLIEQVYNANLLAIHAGLQPVEKSSRLTITVAIDGTSYENSWNIWVYPASQQADFGKVHYTRNLDDAMARLKEGKNVLFNPDWKQVNGLEGKFVPVFWSPVHFPRQAGTMGILCNPEHAALKDFPTDMHTDWQWWNLCINSTTLVTDSLQGGSPVVEVIDNFVNNRRLALIYEGKVGNGKLIIATCNLDNQPDAAPEAKQMLVSLLAYMNGSSFNPSPIGNPEVLYRMIKEHKGDGGKSSPTSYY